MTVIAALAFQGRIYLAADSGAFVNDRPVREAARKMRIVPVGTGGGHALVAFSGDGALAALFDVEAARGINIEPPAGLFDDDRWASQVAAWVTTLGVDAGLVDRDDGRLDALLILGWRGRLWTLLHNQAVPMTDGVAVLGSGGDVALGALLALRRRYLTASVDLDPLDAVRFAVELAVEQHIFALPPIHGVTLDPPPATPEDGSDEPPAPDAASSSRPSI